MKVKRGEITAQNRGGVQGVELRGKAFCFEIILRIFAL